MARVQLALFTMVAISLSSSAEEPASSVDVVKKLVAKLGDATTKGDCATVIDHTCDGLVKEMGGRQKAIELTEGLMKQMKDKGVTVNSFKAGEPGEFLIEGGNTFMIVPTSVEMSVPEGRIVGKSYLLGISPDGGKTWKFADGAGLSKQDFRDKVLPKLPAKLKLPEKQPPEIIKDK